MRSAAAIGWIRRRVVLAVAGAALAAVACAGGEAPAPGREAVLVVATTSIVGDIVNEVAGDAATVEVLLPRGTDPHDYAPSASDVALLTEADLVVANGLGLEETLAAALATAAAEGGSTFELAAAYTRLLPGGEQPRGSEQPGSGELAAPAAGTADPGAVTGPPLDPHIWFDPVQMADAVTALGEVLADTDPAGAAGWTQRAARYRTELLATHEEVADILAAVPPERRQLVTNHDTFAYFADRYDLRVIGAAIPSTSSTAESSAGSLAALAETVREAGVPAVFAENTGDDRLLRNLAAEVGRDVAVVSLLTDALAPTGEPGDTYLSLLLTDARRIADALSGDAP